MISHFQMCFRRVFGHAKWKTNRIEIEQNRINMQRKSAHEREREAQRRFHGAFMWKRNGTFFSYDYNINILLIWEFPFYALTKSKRKTMWRSKKEKTKTHRHTQLYICTEETRKLERAKTRKNKSNWSFELLSRLNGKCDIQQTSIVLCECLLIRK